MSARIFMILFGIALLLGAAGCAASSTGEAPATPGATPTPGPIPTPFAIESLCLLEDGEQVTTIGRVCLPELIKPTNCCYKLPFLGTGDQCRDAKDFPWKELFSWIALEIGDQPGQVAEIPSPHNKDSLVIRTTDGKTLQGDGVFVTVTGRIVKIGNTCGVEEVQALSEYKN